MTDRRSGFTLIELLVVIAIIGILVSAMIAGIGSSKRQQERTAMMALVSDLALAITQYHQNTQKYPSTLTTESSNGSGASDTYGYLHMLNGSSSGGVDKGHIKEVSIGGGAMKKTPQEYFAMKNDYEGPDTDQVYDMWGSPIRYRRNPRNVTDLRKHWVGTGDRALVLGWPGNPKAFNLWSPGPDLSDRDQEYRGTLSPTTGSAASNWKSGGYNDYRGSGDEDYEDDIGNW